MFNKLTVVFLTTIFLLNCKTSNINYQKTANFQIVEAYYQHFFGGIADNLGTIVVLHLDLADEIKPDSIYFLDKVSAVDIKPAERGIKYVGRYKKVTDQEILNYSDVQKENSVHKLDKDEVVLLYHNSSGSFYYKFKDVKPKESLFYPTMRKQMSTDE